MSVLYDLDPTCIDVQSPAVEPSGPGSGSLTPLMLALDNNKIDAAAWLLSKGANTSLADSNGDTAEMRAGLTAFLDATTAKMLDYGE